MHIAVTRTLAVFAALALLSGCAQDVYTMANGQPITDQDKYSSDLYDCKMAAIHEYQEGGPNAGMLAAGALGGAIGGAIMGSTSNLANDKGMKPSDINPAVEKCMSQKDYKGTSK